MNIKSIELQHTNPSLGLNEKIVTVSLIVTEKHFKKVEEFLNQAKVNNTVFLEEYLKAVKNDNEEVINEVLNNAPKNDISKGSKISNLSFYFEENQVVELKDVYRKFDLTHFYPDFTKYMVENGTTDHKDSGKNSVQQILPNKK